MRAGIAVGFAVLAVVAALIAQAPASLLDARLASLSGGQVRIAQAEGTLWQGSGELTLPAGGVRRSVSWRIEAWPLLRGELRGQLGRDADAQRSASFDARAGRLELRGLELGMPMEALLRALGAPALVNDAGGEVSLKVERLLRTADALEARVALQWRQASLPIEPGGARIALGEVRAELSGLGHEIPGTIENSGGEIAIRGTLAAGADGSLRVEADLRPRADIERDHAAAIAAALGLIGSPDGRGGYRVAWATGGRR
jgi:general secretion pathway protein N